MMLAALIKEPLVDANNDELNTNQRKMLNYTKAFGDWSSVRILMLQYDPHTDIRGQSNPSRESVKWMGTSMSTPSWSKFMAL